MNFGVMSYSPIIHYVNLSRNVLGFNPDLVIICVDMTDVFDDNHRYKAITSWDEAGNPVSVKAGIEFISAAGDGKIRSAVGIGREIALRRPLASLQSFNILLLEHSYLYKLMFCKLHPLSDLFALYYGLYLADNRAELERINAINLDDLHGWCRDYEGIEKKGEIDLTLDMLSRIHRLLRGSGVPLMIISLPVRAQLEPPLKSGRFALKPLARLREFCSREGITFAAPIQPLQRAVTQGDSVYHSDNMHLNRAGQTIWADSLVPDVAAIMSKIRAVTKSPVPGRY
jgi:hypothetical protein